MNEGVPNPYLDQATAEFDQKMSQEIDINKCIAELQNSGINTDGMDPNDIKLQYARLKQNQENKSL